MQVNKPRGNWLLKCTKTKAETGITNQKSVSVEIQPLFFLLREEKLFPFFFLSSSFNCIKLSH